MTTPTLEMKTTITKAIEHLKRGNYCLWVGAGVTTQLASASEGPLLGWETLVTELEHAIEAPPHPEGSEYPDRLDFCLRRLGRLEFQRLVKVSIYDALVDRIVKAAKSHNKLADPIPFQIEQIARLGMLANPIVNFNIEALTSEALAGPHCLRCFQAPTMPDLPLRIDRRRASSMFPEGPQHVRNVYHPHGAIDITGLCVLTASEYQAHQGTLAYQIAVHQAFDSDLVIVGMSLDDYYLREQLGAFRGQIRKIIWFTDRQIEPNSNLHYWIWRHEVSVIPVNWSVFWETVGQILPAPNKQEIAWRWISICMNASYATTPAFSRLLKAYQEHGMDRTRIAQHEIAIALRGSQINDEDECLPVGDDIVLPLVMYRNSLAS